MPTNAINDTGVKYLYDKLHGEIEPVAEAVSDSEVTIEGNPLSFNTLSSQNAKSTILSLEPIQDLHGYDKPWVGGANINLMPAGEAKTYTENGITFTSDGNGIYKIKGTSTSVVSCDFNTDTYNVPDGSNHVIGFFNSQSGSSSGKLRWKFFKNDTEVDNWNLSPVNRKTTYSGLSGKEVNKYRIVVESGETLDCVVSPMIVTGTSINDIPSSFSPYENICPISGRSEIGILGCGKNIVDDSKFVRKHAQTGVENDKWLSFDQYIPYKPNVEYVFTSTIGIQSVFLLGIYLYDDELNYVDSMSKTYVNPNNVSFTIPNTNAHYFRFGFYDANSLANYSFENPLLRLASDADSNFEPYTKSNNLTISLGQTVYGGTLDVENGVLVMDNTKIVFDGSSDEGIAVLNTDNPNIWRASIAMPNNSMVWGDGEHISNKLLSNLFEETINSNSRGGGTFYGNVGIHYRANNSHNIVICDGTNKSTENEWRTWLSSNNLEVVYWFATPITINLTPNTINLLKGVNNISTDGDKITLTYRDGSVATLGDLTSAVDNLDSKIDESKILTDTVTGDKYILVVTNGVLSIEQISN